MREVSYLKLSLLFPIIIPLILLLFGQSFEKSDVTGWLAMLVFFNLFALLAHVPLAAFLLWKCRKKDAQYWKSLILAYPIIICIFFPLAILLSGVIMNMFDHGYDIARLGKNISTALGLGMVAFPIGLAIGYFYAAIIFGLLYPLKKLGLLKSN